MQRLQEDATVIEISGQIALDATVIVPADKKVCIRAKDAVTITRKEANFTEDMFNVSGENAELQFDVKEGVAGASFTVSGKISDEESASVVGIHRFCWYRCCIWNGCRRNTERK